jgi:hypothetical protein
LQQVNDIAALATLTLEVNTIRCGMSAQKLSALPIALHIIVEDYADYLQNRAWPYATVHATLSRYIARRAEWQAAVVQRGACGT